MKPWLAVFAVTVISTAAHARVFNYKDSGVSAFVRGTGGYSQLAQDPFANSSGTGVSIDGSTKFGYGAEIGCMLKLLPNLHFRIGAEIIQENPVSEANGADAAGTKLFLLNSSVFVFNPEAGFEYVYSMHGDTRFFAELGVGYANVTVVNSYTMTPAGTTALGANSFKETMETNTLSGIAGLGIETLFTDNVTISGDIGYRYLPVNSLTYKAPVDNIVNPSGVKKGDPVLNADGSKRTFNLGGPFVGITFRFYLNFM